MKKKNFVLAMEILSNYHTTTLVINRTLPNCQVDFGPDNLHIHIKDCCAGAVNELIKYGFTLSMDRGMLSVQDYCMQ